MALTLTIENETSLPDGGPLSVSVTGKRGLDFGRDQHLDWTLPDASRFISGKHCEIRYRDGGYWLYDVSTNGTFLNGAEGRLKGPYRLRNGDRLTIGHYIVAVTIEGEEAAQPQQASAQPVAYHELWQTTGESAPPLDPALLRPAAERRPVNSDFLDWATDIPDSRGSEPQFRPPAPPPPSADPWGDIRSAAAAPPPPPAPAPAPPRPEADFDWAHGAQRPQPVAEPAPAMPSPRRPAVWIANEPSGPWNASPAPAHQPSPQSMPPQAMPPHASLEPALASAPAVQAAPANAAAPSPYPGDTADLSAFLRRLADGAGVPEQIFRQQNPEALAEQLGALMRCAVENLRQLLQARLQAKRLARSSSHTMVEAFDNNPLKFSPTAEDAMRIMFGPPNRSYLDARRTLEQSFDDLKTHQLKTYTAMQQALRMLVAELDPQAIEAESEADRGIAAMVGSRKARLWDAYQARWQAKAARHEGGLIDAFMLYFAECYDRGGGDRR